MPDWLTRPLTEAATRFASWPADERAEYTRWLRDMERRRQCHE